SREPVDATPDSPGHGERPRAGEREGLHDVSFTIPVGGTLGVVGATGSGKSALLELIPRLFDPTRGTVLIDGVPVSELDVAALRREIGFVPQESLLFSDTILANLAYGGTTDDDARWAAGVAQLEDTIASLPAR